MSFIERPEVLLLTLEVQGAKDDIFQPLFDKLHHVAQVKRIKTKAGAMKYLETKKPKSILISDEGLTRARNRALLDRVALYVRGGGVVVVGVHFPSFTTTVSFDRFFSEGFGLFWRRGDYHRSDFRFNPACTFATGMAPSSLPAPYSMKALHVQNAFPHEKIFVPVANAMTQSHVLEPEPVDQSQAAVLGSKVGDGHLFYVGDVNLEDNSRKIIIGLCISGSSSLNDINWDTLPGEPISENLKC